MLFVAMVVVFELEEAIAAAMVLSAVESPSKLHRYRNWVSQMLGVHCRLVCTKYDKPSTPHF